MPPGASLISVISYGASTNRGLKNKVQYLFATFDNHLKLMATLLAEIGTQGASRAVMVRGLSQWWAPKEVELIAQVLMEQVERINSEHHVPKTSDDPDFIPKMIAKGERAVIDAL